MTGAEMNKLKGALLGSAAGLVMTTGLQAADLPMKAKPAEYVKVCSLYGAGFWYVPGTDTCIKLGSYIRVQTEYNAGNGGVPNGFGSNDQAAAGRLDRTDTSALGYRIRTMISLDTRTQTEYGTLRSYLAWGIEDTTNTGSAPNSPSPYFHRAFIQFAGFTAGRIRSFFDVNSLSPYTYEKGSRISGDTGSDGLWGIGYTANFGNGFSATLSVEDGGSGANGNSPGTNRSRGHLVSNLSMSNQFDLGKISYDNEGWDFPDVVGALRVDQSWGYAQVAAALHEASAGYYQTGGTTLAGGIQVNGHPADALGWAMIGGFTLKDVFGLRGDSIGADATYSQGATGYVTLATGPWQLYGSGASAAFGWITDGVFKTGTSVELTTVWGVNGFAQHFWNPKWRTSLYGGYVEVDYDNTAQADICGTAIGGFVSAPSGVALTKVSNCNPNYSWWQVGTRTQWNPHPDLDIGVDVIWSHLNTAFAGTATLATNGARPGGVYTLQNQDEVSVMFRTQRNFLP